MLDIDRPLIEHRLRELEQEQRNEQLLLDNNREDMQPERIAKINTDMSDRAKAIVGVRRQLEL